MGYEWSGNIGDHGKQYQKDLALTLFVRSSLQQCHFELGTKLMDAGKFDDVVLFAESLQEAWLFQTKHSMTRRNVSHKELFPEDVRLKGNDFDLFKYIKSYFFAERNLKKYGLQNKYFIFSNQPFVENEGLEKWVDIVPRHVHSIMDFSRYGAIYRGFKPKGGKIGRIRDNLNKDFITLKNIIIDLLEGKNVEYQILCDFKAHLWMIFELTSKGLKLRETFLVNRGDTIQDCLYEQLKAHDKENNIDLKTVRKDFDNKLKGILKRKFRNVQLPPFVDNAIVEEFFERFTLCINQPSDLRPIIEDDLRLWLKSWLRPDDLGMCGESGLMLSVFRFASVFRKWNEPNVDQNFKNKMFLSYREGAQCIRDIGKELQKSVSKHSEAVERYYINRRIEMPLNNLNNILTFIRDEDFIENLQYNSDDNKCSIVIAEPGMGKTTLLQYIGFEVQKRFQRDVFLIYLNQLNKKFQTVNGCDIESMHQIFEDVLSESSLKILRNNEYLKLLLLDGFDEVTASQRSMAITLIKEFQKSPSIQIIVTGRIHVQKILEQELKVKRIRLDKFSDVDKIKFLKLFWNIPTDNDYKRNNSMLEELPYMVLKSFNYDLLDVPLMMRMLAEVNSKRFYQYAAAGFGKQFFSEVEMFEKFTEISFYMERKKIQGLEAYSIIETFHEDDRMDLQLEQFILEHQLIAIKQLGIKELKNVIDEKENIKHIHRLLERVKNGSEKSVLINFTSEENPVEFVHISYAEYFIVKYVLDNRDKYSENWYEILLQQKQKNNRKIFSLLTNEKDGTHKNAQSVNFKNNDEKMKESTKNKNKSFTDLQCEKKMKMEMAK